MTHTQIAVVEDNPMDVHLLRYAFEAYPAWRTEIVAVLEDGEKAIDYLEKAGSNAPDLVVLDLNIPKRDGTHILRAIRNSPHLYRIPVIVFSSSPEDIIRSKIAGANASAEGYFTKPLGLEEFITMPERFHRCYQAAKSRRSEGRAAGDLD